MVQSVELLLDDGLDDVVRGHWASLRRAGLHGRVPRPGYRPHITLAVASRIPDELDDALRTALPAEPLPIRLGGFVVFGSPMRREQRVVLARAIVPSRELLALHERISRIVASCPGRPGHLAPGEWTPHVTLARHLPVEELGAAVTASTGHDLRGYAGGVRRWDGAESRERRLDLPSPGADSGPLP